MPLRLRAILPHEGPFFPGDVLTCLVTVENSHERRHISSKRQAKSKSEGGATKSLWNWLFSGDEQGSEKADVRGQKSSPTPVGPLDNSGVPSTALDDVSAGDGVPAQFLLWGAAQFVGYYSVDPALVETTKLEQTKQLINYQVIGFETLWNVPLAAGQHFGGGGLGSKTSMPLLYPSNTQQPAQSVGKRSAALSPNSQTESFGSEPRTPMIVSPIQQQNRLFSGSRDSSAVSLDSVSQKSLSDLASHSSNSVLIPTSLAKSVYPIITMPASILFTNLDLKPGEDRSFSYQLELPSKLPGSYPGRCISVAYSLSISIQRTSVSESPLVVNVPIRIYPRSSGELNGRDSRVLDLGEPFIYNESLAHCFELPKIGKKDFIEVGLAKAAVIRPLRAFKASSLLGTLWNHRRIQQALYGQSSFNILPGESQRNFMAAGHEDTNLESQPVKPSFNKRNAAAQSHDPQIGNRVGSNVSSARVQYDIVKDEEFIGRITLLRSAYRLGETIQGIIDFSEAAIPCYKVSVTLESFEIVNPELAKQSRSAIAKMSRRVWGSLNCATTNYRRLPFQISIPTSQWGDGVTTSTSRAGYSQRTFKKATGNTIVTEFTDPDSASAILYAPYGFSPEFQTNVVSLAFAMRFSFTTAATSTVVAKAHQVSDRGYNNGALGGLAERIGLRSGGSNSNVGRVKGILPRLPRGTDKQQSKLVSVHSEVCMFPETQELDIAFIPSASPSAVSSPAAARTPGAADFIQLDARSGMEEFVVAESVSVDLFDCTIPLRIHGWVDEIEGLLEAVKDPNFLQSDVERAIASDPVSVLSTDSRLSSSARRRASVIVNLNSSSQSTSDQARSPLQTESISEEHESCSKVDRNEQFSESVADGEPGRSMHNQKEKRTSLGSDNVFGDICQDEVTFWTHYLHQLEVNALGGQQFQYII